jgi:hypothetical protein
LHSFCALIPCTFAFSRSFSLTLSLFYHLFLCA